MAKSPPPPTFFTVQQPQPLGDQLNGQQVAVSLRGLDDDSLGISCTGNAAPGTGRGVVAALAAAKVCAAQRRHQQQHQQQRQTDRRLHTWRKSSLNVKTTAMVHSAAMLLTQFHPQHGAKAIA